MSGRPVSRASRAASNEGRRVAAWPRNRGGIVFKLILFLAVVFAVGALAWMLFLPMLVTRQLRARTGFDATVESLTANPLTGRVAVRGFVLTNPPTFAVKDFIDLREFRAEAEVFSLFSDRPVFDAMTVDLACVTLVKNREGVTNAGVLQRDLNPAGGGGVRVPGAAPAKRYLIRSLALKLDRLVIVDRSLPQPSVRDYRLGIDQHYLDVTELKQLFPPTVLKNLAPVAAAAGGLLPGDLGRVVGDAAKSGTELLKRTGHRTGEAVKGFFDALEESKKP